MRASSLPTTELVCPKCGTRIPRDIGPVDGNQTPRVIERIPVEPAKAEENVRRFYRELSSVADYGIRGEKPIAVIAAFEYLCEDGLTGVGLLQLIDADNGHSRIVRDHFIGLASKYASLASASNSWGVITGLRSSDRTSELERAIKGSLGLDRSVASLSHDQICSLLREFVQKLDEQATKGKLVTI